MLLFRLLLLLLLLILLQLLGRTELLIACVSSVHSGIHRLINLCHRHIYGCNVGTFLRDCQLWSSSKFEHLYQLIDGPNTLLRLLLEGLSLLAFELLNPQDEGRRCLPLGVEDQPLCDLLLNIEEQVRQFALSLIKCIRSREKDCVHALKAEVKQLLFLCFLAMIDDHLVDPLDDLGIRR